MQLRKRIAAIATAHSRRLRFSDNADRSYFDIVPGILRARRSKWLNPIRGEE
jgi:hypothetical protein